MHRTRDSGRPPWLRTNDLFIIIPLHSESRERGAPAVVHVGTIIIILQRIPSPSQLLDSAYVPCNIQLCYLLLSTVLNDSFTI